MDLREFVRNHEDTIVGHKPVDNRLNLQKEISRFKKDPLSVMLK